MAHGWYGWYGWTDGPINACASATSINAAGEKSGGGAGDGDEGRHPVQRPRQGRRRPVRADQAAGDNRNDEEHSRRRGRNQRHRVERRRPVDTDDRDGHENSALPGRSACARSGAGRCAACLAVGAQSPAQTQEPTAPIDQHSRWIDGHGLTPACLRQSAGRGSRLSVARWYSSGSADQGSTWTMASDKRGMFRNRPKRTCSARSCPSARVKSGCTAMYRSACSRCPIQRRRRRRISSSPS